MCLSKAFLLRSGEQELLLDSVCSIRTDDGEIVLTDIIGEVSRLRGTICNVDLIRNTIMILPEAPADTAERFVNGQ